MFHGRHQNWCVARITIVHAYLAGRVDIVGLNDTVLAQVFVVLAQVSSDEVDEGVHTLALTLGTDVNFPLARYWLYLKQRDVSRLSSDLACSKNYHCPCIPGGLS